MPTSQILVLRDKVPVFILGPKIVCETGTWMMKDKGYLESEIMKTVRQSPPTKPAEIVERVSHNSEDAKTAREAIRSLVDKGALRVTLDWKVRAAK
jgi:hypothetical protein